MKRYYIIYEGIVQGVGFRWRLMMYAKQLNLSGWCRNLDNGNVECAVQGKDVDKFLKLSTKSERFAKIFNWSVKEIPLEPHESVFTVRF